MTENPLGYEKISKLLKGFAIPSILAALVGSLYNIVDQGSCSKQFQKLVQQNFSYDQISKP